MITMANQTIRAHHMMSEGRRMLAAGRKLLDESRKEKT